MRYEEYIQQGDDLRTNHRPAPAAVQYMIALEVSGPRDRYVMHMLGVCCQMMELFDRATEWYLLAMEGASDYERGNIECHMAAAYDALEEHDLAEISLATALDLLRYEEHPDEHAATLRCLARHQLLVGQLEEAIDTFADADAKQHEGHSPSES